MDFCELFANLVERRRMFLPDDRYYTLVAFVEGCNAATGWELLAGFNQWTAAQVLGHQSSLHWSVVIASKSSPEMLKSGHGAIPSEIEASAAADLLKLLDEFLRGQIETSRDAVAP